LREFEEILISKSQGKAVEVTFKQGGKILRLLSGFRPRIQPLVFALSSHVYLILFSSWLRLSCQYRRLRISDQQPCYMHGCMVKSTRVGSFSLREKSLLYLLARESEHLLNREGTILFRKEGTS
jgi:hypothetical protein